MSNAGQVALSIVGGVIGFIYGGPYGAVYGASLGGLVGNAAFPTQLPPITGPRLQDNKMTAMQVGSPVAELFGTDIVSGTVMWLGPVREVATTEEVGGKGGPEQDVTTYTYFQPIAIGLCARVGGDLGGTIWRIWENGKLVYDIRPQLPGESLDDFQDRAEFSGRYRNGFDTHYGNEDQLPDITIESYKGVGNVPAFRGLMYIVYPDRQLLDDQGLRHPNFKFEITDEPELFQ